MILLWLNCSKDANKVGKVLGCKIQSESSVNYILLHPVTQYNFLKMYMEMPGALDMFQRVVTAKRCNG